MTRFLPNSFLSNVIARGVLLICFLSFASTRVYAQATIQTDKSDYPPGSTVIITGSGFAANEAVTLQVLHYGTVGDNVTSPAHQPWTVTADSLGNVSSTWLVPLDDDEAGSTLQLTAVGQTSGFTASEIFTDANPSWTVTSVSGTYGQAGSVTVTATLSNNANKTPNFTISNGTISFSGGGTLVTTNPPNSNTQATFTFYLTSDGLIKSGSNTLLAASSATNIYTVTAAVSSTTSGSGTLTVNRAPLTAKADNQTKVYGQVNPSPLTITYTGFVGTESATNLPTPLTAATAATQFSPIGNYAITVSGAGPSPAADGNYTVTYSSGTLSVTPAPLTAKADNQTKVYGQVNPSPLTITYTGFVGTESATNLPTPLTAATAATQFSPIGNYAITVSGAGPSPAADGNYTVTYSSGTLSVTPAPLTAKADNQTKVYGQVNPSPLTITYTGFVGTESATNLPTPLTAATAATQFSPIGNYAITVSGAGPSPAADGNYTVTYSSGTLSVTPAPLTAKADNQTKVYGQVNPSPLTITYTGFVGTESATNLPTPLTAATAATQFSPIGNYAITVSGAGPSPAADGNYTVTYSSGTLSVTPAPLTAKADNQTKVYGQVNPSPLTITYTGFVGTESATNLPTPLTAATAATQFSPIGNYAITVSGAGPSPAADGNYTVTYSDGTLSVTPAPLTAKADNQTKVYGQVNPSPLTITYTGFVGTESATNLPTPLTAATAATQFSPIGNYAITVSGAGPSPAADGNYTVTYSSGTLSVTPAPLTAKADNQTKVYGQVNPSPLTITYTGFVGTESATNLPTPLTAATAATQFSPIGNYAITVSGAGPSPAADGNYTVTYSDGTLSVTPAPLTAKADNQTKVYGQVNPSPLTITYTGFVGTESATNLPTPLTAATAATQFSPIGNYAITVSGAGPSPAADGNYTVTYSDGTLSVTPAPLTAKADNQTKVYGQVNPSPLTITYTGFVGTESATNLPTPLTAATAATQFSPIGNYAITVSGAGPSPAADGNYTVTYSSGTLSVTPAPLTAKADNQTKVYGQVNPSPLTITYTGFVGTESATNLPTPLTAATAATQFSPIGNYAITVSGAGPSPAADGNYTVTYSSGTLSVTRAPLTAKADNQTKVYGQVNPSPLTITYTGFVGTESATNLPTPLTAATAATQFSPIGNYAITVSGAGPSPAADGNYTVTYSSGTLSVTPAPLTAKADNQTKVYGQVNPSPLTITYTGFVGTESATNLPTPLTAATAATQFSPIGNYAITVSGAGPSPAADGNYTVTYSDGTLSVTPAPLTAKADNQTKVYGQVNPSPLTITYTGFVGTESATNLPTPLTAATAATQFSPIGNYAITVSGAGPSPAADGNYTVTYSSGTLSVTPAPLTAKADNQTKVYGQVNPSPLTITYTGFVGTESATNLPTPLTAATAATQFSPIGNYAITVSGAGPSPAADGNYTVTYSDGTLSVTPAPLTAKADNQTKVYGQVNPSPLTITYTGFVGTESATNLPTPLTAATAATQFSPIGNYAITVSGAGPSPAADGNYTVTYSSGTLSVTPAPLTAKADNQTKVYGQVNPSPLTITYTGFVGTESATNLPTPLTAATAATQFSPIGNYAITVSGAGPSPAADGNYTVTYSDGTLSVTPAPLTAKADNQTKVYGQVNPSPLTITYTGFVGTESATNLPTPLTAATAATQFSPIGNYAITVSGAGPSPAADGNYTVTYSDGTLSVTPAPLTAKADNQTKVYGQVNPSPLTITYTGFVGTESATNLPTPLTAATAATQFSPIGNYAITVSGAGPSPAADGNYTVTYSDGTLSVTPAPLTAKADNQTKVYGQVNPSPLTITYTGFVGTESATNLPTPLTAATAATQFSPIGNYAITVSGAGPSPAADGNYTVTYSDGTLSVTPAPLTAKADNQTKVYGQVNPSPLTITYTGFVGTESATNLPTPLTAATAATQFSPIGNYAITVSGAGPSPAADGNYTVTYSDGTLSVTPAPLTAKADNQTKVYGQVNPSPLTITYTGFVGTESATNLPTPLTAATAATQFSPIGNYAITVSGAGPSPAADGNYTVTYSSGTLSVTPAPLTAKADNQTKVYGQVNPSPLTITYTGFVGTESATNLPTPLTAATAATQFSPIGNYAITVSGAGPSPAADGNYTVTYSDGTLSVTPAPLTAKADNQTKVYGQVNPSPLTITYTGFVGTESATNLPTPLTITTTATTASGVGPYPITVSGPAPVSPSLLSVDGNYALTYVPGTLTVTTAPVCASYIGTLFANTCASCGTVADTAHVMLKVVINTPTNGNEDARTAQVTFKVGSTSYPATLVSGGTMYQAVFAYYPLAINIGTAPSLMTTVNWTIGGNFITGNDCAETSTVVTVSARTSDFVTGGGFIVLNTPPNPQTNPPATISAGKYKGDPGSKTNFGFNVKWNKSLSNIIGGGFNAIVRAGAVTYVISAPKVATLVFVPAVGLTPASAAFTSTNATLTPTDANTGAIVGGGQMGNLNLTVQMTDVCEPGPGANASSDQISITLKDSKGNLYYSNDWGASASIQQPLGGGNLQVHGDAGTSSAPLCTPTSGKTVVLETPTIKNLDEQGIPLSATIYPNPSISNFNMQLAGGSTDKLDITVTDVLGHVIEVHKVMPGSLLTVGNNLRTGMYLIQVKQGQTFKFYRVFKQ